MDHAWVTRDELQKYLSASMWNAVKDALQPMLGWKDGQKQKQKREEEKERAEEMRRRKSEEEEKERREDEKRAQGKKDRSAD